MKKIFLIAVVALFSTLNMSAAHLWDNSEPLKLNTPEMKPELVKVENVSYENLAEPVAEPKMDFDFFKSKTNPGTKPYKFMDDMTFVGVPLFVAGLIAKSEKNAFKQQTKHSLLTKFKTEIDDYTQFFGPAAVVGLKLAGVEGRSDWPRLLANAGMSYGLMALMVNVIKNTAKEMRPDGSTANSWPSGHTATAFVGATLLHKEYGLTRSPWYSVAGYGVATATGVMRVLFFSISMGIGFGSRNLDFDLSDFGWAENMNLKFRAATAVSAEGAYFFNPYIGVGGRLRVKSSPINGWNNIVEKGWDDAAYFYGDYDEKTGEYVLDPTIGDAVSHLDFVIESDHLTEFAADLGAYFNFPLSERFALGGKVLVGRSIMQSLGLDGQLKGKSLKFDEGKEEYVVTDKPFDTTWDYFTVEGNNTMKYGTGISLTYAYKQNFSWKIFFDYDFTRKTYTMTYDPKGFYQDLFPELQAKWEPTTKSIKKNMNSFVLGGSFAVNF